MHNKYINTLHKFIDDEYEGRACLEISDKACKVVPGNALFVIVSLVLSKIADTLASAKIVLPWLMTATGAPIFLISLLVPIREAGSMLPQLILGAFIRQKPIRKNYLVVGALLQSVMIAGLLLVGLYLTDMLAGIAIVVLTLFFSLARAIASIASKDVIGKTIPKKKRGLLTGKAATISGLFSIVLGGMLLFYYEDKNGVSELLIIAIVSFTLCALTWGFVKEYPGATSGSVNGLSLAVDNLVVACKNKDFVRFVIVRGLMITSGLGVPYFVLLIQQETSGTLSNLGSLIILSGAASFVSGAIWGRLADRNSKGLITLIAIINMLIFLVGMLVHGLDSASLYGYLAFFFSLSVMHEGVRQARKTYIIDMAEDDKRTAYVTVSNTLIGILLLFIGAVSGVIAHYSITAVLATFAMLSLIAAMLSTQLKNVSQ
ncbi:MFS transporter [Aliikangiella marina]|uniref:MFS transporter n=1 Tax=Aliikangiella marina TaxID=1712262 RepID=A0A545TJM0_9GAMM|nr:MFS transporter [Aliikangiella marina]TQV77397.1 MFS transporter [Aliikangiella marina]